MRIRELHGFEIRTTSCFEEIAPQATPYLTQAKRQSVFTTPAWLAALEATQQMRYFLILTGSKVEGFASVALERRGTASRLVCVPQQGGALVFKKPTKMKLAALCSVLREEARSLKAASISLRFGREDDLGLMGPLRAQGFDLVHANCDFVAPLEKDSEAQLALCSTSRRNEVRQALKREAEVVWHKDGEGFFPIFYPLYLETMARKGVSPTAEEALRSQITLAASQLLLVSARVEGEHVAAVAVVANPQESTLHYLYSALGLAGEWHRPMERLIYALMCHGAENGYAWFDFMGTSADFTSGVYRFKRQWGARAKSRLFLELTLSPIARTTKAVVSLLRSLKR